MACKIVSRAILLLVFVNAQQEPTVIQQKHVNKNVNKNVNIIVNLSPREVALELFKVLEDRLMGNFTRRSMSTRNTLKELENAVVPLVSPSRRSAGSSFHELANDLDRISRRALIRDFPLRDSLDEEILTRDVVAEMMVVLKKITRERQRTDLAQKFEENNDRLDSRKTQDYQSNYDEDEDSFEDAFTVTVKLRRKDVYRMIKAIND